jgi:HEAT repeat protein
MKRATLIPVMLFAVLALTTSGSAQDKIRAFYAEQAAKNLVIGINSDNEGLSRSSIYYAGKDKVTEAVDALIEKMGKEKDPDTRILIAFSLYQIGDFKGLEAVKEQTVNDSDQRVIKMSALIYDQFYRNYTGNYGFSNYYIAKTHLK